MASNTFGALFSITTWGESHGKAVGVVIDGCPAGLPLCEDDINAALARRAPGSNPYVSPRQEKDTGSIVSGVFEGITTGTPISIIIENTNADSSKYEPIKELYRPGHANFTYLHKYGVFDYRGGGRASARETACRVAAGAVARALLTTCGIEVTAHLSAVGGVTATAPDDPALLRQAVASSALFVAEPHAEMQMGEAILQAMQEGDSLGGVVSFLATGLPVGLGEPLYDKVPALLAKAMFSISACKGFEMGEGFAAAAMKGSEHNDTFITRNGRVTTATNHAGGTLGGMTTGLPLTGRVAFKPTASISIPQPTVDTQGREAEFNLPAGSRHDPCVAIRAVPVVEAMCLLVLADTLLLHRARQREAHS